MEEEAVVPGSPAESGSTGFLSGFEGCRAKLLACLPDNPVKKREDKSYVLENN